MISEETAKDAQRNILLGWDDLSPGDVSVIRTMMTTGSTAMTIRDSPHGRFWAQAVRLGWAVEGIMPPDLARSLSNCGVFRPTTDGRTVLARFVDHWKLFDKSAFNHAPRDRKPPIVFLRDGVFALLDPAKYPLNFTMLPMRGYDALAEALERSGGKVVRSDHLPG